MNLISTAGAKQNKSRKSQYVFSDASLRKYYLDRVQGFDLSRSSCDDQHP